MFKRVKFWKSYDSVIVNHLFQHINLHMFYAVGVIIIVTFLMLTYNFCTNDNMEIVAIYSSYLLSDANDFHL